MQSLISRLNQRVPISELNIPETISESEQSKILDTIVSIAVTNGHYSSMFLRKFMSHLENSNVDILDELYEQLAELLSCQPLNPTDHDIILYSLRVPSSTSEESRDIQDILIKVRESPRLIAGLGTTGLRTWEASLFLAEYLYKNLLIEPTEIVSDFENKTVMELGCGTGFVGMALYLFYQGRLKKIVLTDGDSQLFDNILYNLQLNGITSGTVVSNDDDNAKDITKSSSGTDATENNDNTSSITPLEIAKLWWADSPLPAAYTDTIIAADVTYDSSVIPSLIQVLAEAMGQDNVVSSGDGEIETNYGRVDTAYIAATVRNDKTLEVWEECLDMGVSDGIWNWGVCERRIMKECDSPMAKEDDDEGIWYPVGTPEIRIYKLVRLKVE